MRDERVRTIVARGITPNEIGGRIAFTDALGWYEIRGFEHFDRTTVVDIVVPNAVGNGTYVNQIDFEHMEEVQILDK